MDTPLHLLAVAVIASMMFPILAPIPLLVGRVLFAKRIAFVFEHVSLVLIGIAVYVAAFAFHFSGMALYWSIALLVALNPGSMLWALGTVAVLGGLVMHVALWVCARMGYRTAIALEIMSIIPLLIVSLILPFLKLSFDFAPVGMAAKHTSLAEAPTVYSDPQGTFVGRLLHEAGGLRVTDNVGRTTFHVQNMPPAEIHTDASYHTQFPVQVTGEHHTVSDAAFQAKFRIQPFGSGLLLKRRNGTNLYMATFIGQDAHVDDSQQVLVAKVANAPRSSTLFRGLLGAG